MIKSQNLKAAVKLFDIQSTQQEHLYQQILAVEPDNVYALTGLAFCKSNQKNKIEAFQLLQKAYKLDPEDHETNFHLGVHYLDGVKNLNESLKHFEKAQETSDNDLDKTKTLFNIAKVYEENNEHEKAREAYLKVLEINPKDHKAMVNAALISDKLGNRDEAIKLLEQAVSLKATDRRIYTNLGAFHRLKGNFDESQKYLDEAKKISQNLEDISSSDSDSDDDRDKDKIKDQITKTKKKSDSEYILINRVQLAKDSDNENYNVLLEEAYNVVMKNTRSKGRLIIASLLEQEEDYEKALELLMIEKQYSGKYKDKDLEKYLNEQIQFNQGKLNNDEPTLELDGPSPKNQQLQDEGLPTTPLQKSNTQYLRMGTKRTTIMDEGEKQLGLSKNKTMNPLKAAQKTQTSPGFSRQATGSVTPISNKKKKKSNKGNKFRSGNSSGTSKQSRSVIQEEDEEDEEDDDDIGGEDDDEGSQGEDIQENDQENDDEDEQQEDKHSGEDDDGGDLRTDEDLHHDHEEAKIDAKDEQLAGDIGNLISKLVTQNDDKQIDHQDEEEDENKDKFVYIDSENRDIKLFNDESMNQGVRNSNIQGTSSIRYSQDEQDDQLQKQTTVLKEEEEHKQSESFQQQATKISTISHNKEVNENKLLEEWEEWNLVTCQYRLQQNEKDIYAIMRLARITLFDDRRDASHLLNQINKLDPEFRKIEILEMTIKCYDNLGRLERSIDLYDNLIEIYKEQGTEQKLFDSIFQKGKCLERMKNYKGALNVYRECLVLQIISSKVYLRIAQCYKKLADFEKSAENLENAIRIETTSQSSEEKSHIIDHLLNLAAIYYQNLNNFEKSKEYALRVIEKDPQNGGALVILGRIYEKQGNAVDAVKYFEQVYQIQTFALEANFRLGKLMEQQGKDKKAVFYYKNTLNIKKTHFDSLLSLGNILLKQEYYERCLKYFKHALLFRKDNIDALFGYSKAMFYNQQYGAVGERADMSSSITGSKSNIGGMLSSRTGRLGVQLTRQGSAMSSEVDGITKNLLKIISIDPQYSGAYRLLGEILLTKKDYDKAIENLKKALLLNKNDCEALNLLGKVIQASGKADTAIQYYKESLKSNPLEIRSLVNLGNAYYETQKYKEALLMYDQALALDNDMADVHYDKAMAYLNLNILDKAIESYKQACQLNPHKVDYFYNLGAAYSLQENYSESLAAFDKAISLDPLRAHLAHFNKGNILYMQKKYPQSIKAYQKSLEVKEKQKDCHFNLAHAYQEIGEFQNAIAQLKLVIEIDEKGEDAYLNLAHIYEVDLKEKELAQAIYKKILKLFPDNEKARKLLNSQS